MVGCIAKLYEVKIHAFVAPNFSTCLSDLHAATIKPVPQTEQNTDKRDKIATEQVISMSCAHGEWGRLTVHLHHYANARGGCSFVWHCAPKSGRSASLC